MIANNMTIDAGISNRMIERDQLERYMTVYESAHTQGNIMRQDELDYEIEIRLRMARPLV